MLQGRDNSEQLSSHLLAIKKKTDQNQKDNQLPMGGKKNPHT